MATPTYISSAQLTGGGLTGSVTVPSGAVLAYVHAAAYAWNGGAGLAITAITLGGTAMDTLTTVDGTAGDDGVACGTLLDTGGLTTGSQTLTVTTDVTPDSGGGPFIVVHFFSDVSSVRDQDAGKSGSDPDTNTLTLTSQTGDVVFGTVNAYQPGSALATATGQTHEWAGTTVSDFRGDASSVDTTGDPSTTYSSAADLPYPDITAVVLVPTAGAGVDIDSHTGRSEQQGQGTTGAIAAANGSEFSERKGQGTTGSLTITSPTGRSEQQGQGYVAAFGGVAITSPTGRSEQRGQGYTALVGPTPVASPTGHSEQRGQGTTGAIAAANGSEFSERKGQGTTGSLTITSPTGRSEQQGQGYTTSSTTPTGALVGTLAFVLPTSTGLFDVTGLSFTPVAVKVYTVLAVAADAYEAGAGYGIGFSDGTTEACIGTYFTDGGGSPDTGRAHRSSGVINNLVTSITNDSLVSAVSSGAGPISGGWRFNVTTAPGVAYRCVAEFYGGDGVQAVVSNVTVSAGSVTGLGFAPNMVQSLNQGLDLDDAAPGSTLPAFGIAVNTAGGTQQVCSALAQVQGNDAAQVTHHLDDTVFAGQGFRGSQGWDWSAAITSWNSDGVSWSGSNTDEFSLLLLNTGSTRAWVDVVDTPTTAITQVYTGPGFTPQFLGGVATLLTGTPPTYDNANLAGSYTQLSMDAVSANSASITIDQDANPEDTSSRFTASSVLVPTDAQTTAYQFTLDSFDENGFTLDFSAAPATASKMMIYAFEEGAATVKTSHTGRGSRVNLGYTVTQSVISATTEGVDSSGNPTASQLNTTYDPGPFVLRGEGGTTFQTVTLSGVIPGTSTVTGTVDGTGALSGIIPGTSTVVATLDGAGDLSGVIPGTSTVTGTLDGAGALSGVIPGTSTVVAILDGAGDLSGVIPGTSTVTATIVATGDLSGVIPGTSIVTGTVASGGDLSGIIPGTSTVVATLDGAGALSGVIPGTSTVTGTLDGAGALSGVIPGTSTVVAILDGAGDLSGVIPGTSTVTATIVATGDLSGVIPGTSTVTGTLDGAGALSGVIPGTSVVTGTLDGAGDLSGVIPGTSTVTGTVEQEGLSGIIPGTSVVTGTVGGAGALSGIISGTSTVTGTVAGVVDISGIIPGTSTVVATLDGAGALSGVIPGTSTVVATLDGAGDLSGVIPGTSTVTGTVASGGDLSGVIPGTSTVTATVAGVGALSGVIPGTSTVTGTVASGGDLSGVIPGTSTVVATIVATGALSGVIPGTSTVTATIDGTGALSGLIPGTSVVTATVAGTGALSGVIPGASTVTGTVEQEGLVGAIAGTSVVTGSLGKAASSTGTSTVTGTIVATGDLSGVIPGTSTVTATVAGVGALSGVIPGTSTVTGTVASGGDLSGVIPGVSTVTGTIVATGDLSGVIPGTSVVTGTIVATGDLSGTIPGTSAVTGSGELRGYLTATSPGTSVVTATIVATGDLSGTISGTSVASGIPEQEGLVGTSPGTSTVTGAIAASGDLSGTIPGTSATVTTLYGVGEVLAAAAGVALVVGSLFGAGALFGTISGDSTVSGSLGGDTQLSGASLGTSAVTATVNGIGGLSGVTSSTSTVSGVLSSVGISIGTSTVTGNLLSLTSIASATGTCLVQGRLANTSYSELPDLSPRKSIGLAHPLGPDDLCITLTTTTGNRYSPALIRYSIYKVQANGSLLLVNPDRTPVPGAILGHFYAVGSLVDQPGTYEIQWRYRVYLDGPDLMESMRYSVDDAVITDGLDGRIPKLGWT